MKKVNQIILLCIMLSSIVYGKEIEKTISSPDGLLRITVQIQDQITWELTYNDQIVAGPSPVSLTLLQQGVLGENPTLVNSFTESKNETIQTSFYKKSSVRNHYNALILEFKNDYSLQFRVFNEGAAYRFVTNIEDEIKVVNERVSFVFPESNYAYIPYIGETLGRYQSPFERVYEKLKVEKIVGDSLILTPLMVTNQNGTSVVITEANLENYPGMFLKANENANGFIAEHAAFPMEEKQGGYNNLQSIVNKRADYIAKTNGDRTFPWRVIAVAENDYELLDNDLVYNLAEPSRIEDESWIKPGKVAWDWWNDWNLYNVDFRAGINTNTYKYYIDFAAEFGIEYVILDDGWSESTDLLKIVPEINLQEIIDYGKERGVDIVLWAGWLPLDRDMDKVLKKYSKMGVKGYKIDFMNRDDQKMVDFYYRVAEKTAFYKQIVLFHGAYKPTGLHRTYPNVLTFEGVFGLEQVKWTSYKEFPKYDVTAPYIRMLAGPMDYTPGAMRNANLQNWRAINSEPMSQGTRCHQLAMYILYESPFSMLADNPVNYQREPECTEFIASIPTVFDETVALAGEVGEYLAIARRKGDAWYIAAMTNWDPGTIELNLSFLPKKEYSATVFSDGINADRAARDYKKETIILNNHEKIQIDMQPGGGWAAILKPVD
ncbi:MAG: Retaining alpha-galactosidase [Bacteroidetes bacterium]|jgi:alpha-glucosidase|nr:Retaining alpha-galactosidase [Bacteroidota bacterium]